MGLPISPLIGFSTWYLILEGTRAMNFWVKHHLQQTTYHRKLTFPLNSHCRLHCHTFIFKCLYYYFVFTVICLV